MGFKRAGCSIAGAVDVDVSASATYREYFKADALTMDIRKLDGKSILKIFGLKRSEIDIVVGCPPCQGFTKMRNGEGEGDPRNGLVRSFLRIVSDLKPQYLTFENVPGILDPLHRDRFDALRRSLKRQGYETEYGVLQAAHFGVPQFRKRLVFLARRGTKPELPEETHAPERGEGRREWRTVGKTIRDLPPLRAGEQHPRIKNHNARNHSPKVRELLKRIPRNGGSREDIHRRYWLDCHKEHDGHHDVYGRMTWDEPSPTITSGCTNPSRGRFVHPTQSRGLSPREAARLQTFPDSFAFHGLDHQIEAQIGNAFPPVLAERIAEALLA